MAAVNRLSEGVAPVGFAANEDVMNGDDAPELTLNAVKDGGHEFVEKAVSIRPELASTVDAEGNSLLHWAVLRGDLVLLELLLSNQCSAFAKNGGGSSVIAWASMQGHVDCARLLVRYGADVNEPDAAGVTPLLLSAQHSQHMMMLWLLEHGANVLSADLHGNTAAHWSAQLGDVPALQLLAASGQAGRAFVAPDREGALPVHRAAKAGRVQAVLWFIDHAYIDPRIRLWAVLGPTYQPHPPNAHHSQAGVAALGVEEDMGNSDSEDEEAPVIHAATSATPRPTRLGRARLCLRDVCYPARALAEGPPHPASLTAIARMALAQAKEGMRGVQAGRQASPGRASLPELSSLVDVLQRECALRDAAEASMAGACQRLLVHGCGSAVATAKLVGPLSYLMFLAQALAAYLSAVSGMGNTLLVTTLYCTALAVLLLLHTALWGATADPLVSKNYGPLPWNSALLSRFSSPLLSCSAGLTPMHAVYPVGVRRVRPVQHGGQGEEEEGEGSDGEGEEDGEGGASSRGEDRGFLAPHGSRHDTGGAGGGGVGMTPWRESGDRVALSLTPADALYAQVCTLAAAYRRLYSGQDLAAKMSAAASGGAGGGGTTAAMSHAPKGSCMAQALARVCWACLHVKPLRAVHDATSGACYEGYHVCDPTVGAVIHRSNLGAYVSFLATHTLACTIFLACCTRHVLIAAEEGATVVRLAQAAAAAAEAAAAGGGGGEGGGTTPLGPETPAEAAESLARTRATLADLASMPTTWWAVLLSRPSLLWFLTTLSLALAYGLYATLQQVRVSARGLTAHEAQCMKERSAGPVVGALLPRPWSTPHASLWSTGAGRQGLQAGGMAHLVSLQWVVLPGPGGMDSGTLQPVLSNPWSSGKASGWAAWWRTLQGELARPSRNRERGRVHSFLRSCLPSARSLGIYSLLSMAGYRTGKSRSRSSRAQPQPRSRRSSSATTATVASAMSTSMPSMPITPPPSDGGPHSESEAVSIGVAEGTPPHPPIPAPAPVPSSTGSATTFMALEAIGRGEASRMVAIAKRDERDIEAATDGLWALMQAQEQALARVQQGGPAAGAGGPAPTRAMARKRMQAMRCALAASGAYDQRLAATTVK